MIKAAIIDFDGTLFDSMHIWKDVAGILIKNEGKLSDETKNIETRNMSILQASQYLKKEYGLNYTVEEIISKICKIVEDFYFNEVEPKPGAINFVKELDKAGVEQFIISANEKYLIEHCLKKYKIDKYFKDIITCTEIKSNKDNPETFNIAFERINEDKKHCFVFDDSYYAIKAAKIAGFKTVGIYDSNEPRTNKVQEESDFYIEDFNQVPDLWKFFKRS